MRASSDLAKLRAKAVHRTNRLIFQARAIRGELPIQRTADIGFLIIELDNLIINFNREFLLSVLLRARTCGGSRVSSSVQPVDEQEALRFIFNVINPVKLARLESAAIPSGSTIYIDRRSEEKIRCPRTVDRVLRACGASNVSSFNRALSLNAKVFDEIATVRNFYAHRNAHTHMKLVNIARSAGFFSIDCADNFILSHRPSRISSIINEWLFDVRDFVEFATE